MSRSKEPHRCSFEIPTAVAQILRDAGVCKKTEAVVLGQVPGSVQLSDATLRVLSDGIGFHYLFDFLLGTPRQKRKYPTTPVLRLECWDEVNERTEALLGFGLSKERKSKILCGDEAELLDLLHAVLQIVLPSASEQDDEYLGVELKPLQMPSNIKRKVLSPAKASTPSREVKTVLMTPHKIRPGASSVETPTSSQKRNPTAALITPGELLPKKKAVEDISPVKIPQQDLTAFTSKITFANVERGAANVLVSMYERHIKVIQTYYRWFISCRTAQFIRDYLRAVEMFQARFRLRRVLRQMRVSKREAETHRCKPIMDQMQVAWAFHGSMEQRTAWKYISLCCPACVERANAVVSTPMPSIVISGASADMPVVVVESPERRRSIDLDDPIHTTSSIRYVQAAARARHSFFVVYARFHAFSRRLFHTASIRRKMNVVVMMIVFIGKLIAAGKKALFSKAGEPYYLTSKEEAQYFGVSVGVCHKCKPIFDLLLMKMTYDHTARRMQKFANILCMNDEGGINCRVRVEQVVKFKQRTAVKLFYRYVYVFWFIAQLTPDIRGEKKSRFPASVKMKTRKRRKELMFPGYSISMGFWAKMTSFGVKQCKRCIPVINYWAPLLCHACLCRDDILAQLRSVLQVGQMQQSSASMDASLSVAKWSSVLCVSCQKNTEKMVGCADRYCCSVLVLILKFCYRLFYRCVAVKKAQRRRKKLQKGNWCFRCECLRDKLQPSRYKSYHACQQSIANLFCHAVKSSNENGNCEELIAPFLLQRCRDRFFNIWRVVTSAVVCLLRGKIRTRRAVGRGDPLPKEFLEKHCDRCTPILINIYERLVFLMKKNVPVGQRPFIDMGTVERRCFIRTQYQPPLLCQQCYARIDVAIKKHVHQHNRQLIQNHRTARRADVLGKKLKNRPPDCNEGFFQHCKEIFVAEVDKVFVKADGLVSALPTDVALKKRQQELLVLSEVRQSDLCDACNRALKKYVVGVLQQWVAEEEAEVVQWSNVQ